MKAAIALSLVVGAQLVIIGGLTDPAGATGAPAVTSISPNSGPVGTTVTVSGSGFTGATQVEFGYASSTDVSVVSDSELTATAPPGGAGTVDITVTTPNGTSATSSADQFAYAFGATTAWGLDNNEQLGPGASSGTTPTPTAVPLPGTPTQVAAGSDFSLALVDGNVYAWGNDGSGQLGNGGFNSTYAEVAAGADTACGTYLCNVVYIAAGDSDSYAITSSGAVYSWGLGSDDALGRGTNTNAASYPVAMTLTNLPTGVTPVALSGGYRGGQILTSAGTLFGWGYNNWGEVGNNTATDVSIPTQVSSSATFTQVVEAEETSYGLTSTGTVYSWGWNSNGQLGNGTHSNTATKVPTQISALSGVTAIDGGSDDAFALTSNGTLYAWGYNSNGQLGLGGTGAAYSPTQVTAIGSTGDPIGAVTAGGVFTLVTLADGTLWGWGSDASGELGSNGNDGNQFTPVEVAGVGNLGQVSAGNGHTLALGWLPPTVSSVAPAAGPTTGGTSVTITGTNFVAPATVDFGATAATDVTVTSATSVTATAPAGSPGTVDVTVTTQAGVSATSSADQFAYVAAPTVTGISPSGGPTGGGTSVTVTGTNLTGANAVSFGGVGATTFNVDSSTQITATSPPGSAGTVDVTVTTVGGTSATSSADQFAYVAAPTVTGISPSGGPTGGGTSVTITGTGLSGATAVSFGGTAATAFAINSSTQITATSPPGSAGTVDVTVTTVGGTSATSSADQFTYVATPSVTAVSPNAGPEVGGTLVTITGANLTGANAVSFGDSPAATFVVNSDSQITATDPPGSADTVDVTVTTAGGTSAPSTADQFTYTAAPIVTSVAPSVGALGGGSTVAIAGTGFTAATAVDFGANPASYTVNSDNQITAIAPAGSAGTDDVTVTTAGGTSATSSADQFTYQPAPTVTAVSPNAGPLDGGTTVTITGSGLTGASAVDFGSMPAGVFSVNSDSSITVNAPAEAAGTVDITVTTPGGISPTSSLDQFTYQPVPTVTAVSPNAGPVSGGTTVTVTGTDLENATAVDFGSMATSNYTVTSDTQLTATAPAGSAGAVDIAVTTPGGTSPTSSADQFTYQSAPAVTAVSPNAGPVTGGTAVTLTGTNLENADGVNFGSTPAASYTVNSSTSITATSPSAAAGTVDVTVSTSGGTSGVSCFDRFTYGSSPTVNCLDWDFLVRPTAVGGTSVSVFGSNLDGATAVNFGSTAATSFVADSSSEITAVAPAGAPGVVDITVTTPVGTSATSSGDQFTYTGETPISSSEAVVPGSEVTIHWLIPKANKPESFRITSLGPCTSETLDCPLPNFGTASEVTWPGASTWSSTKQWWSTSNAAVEVDIPANATPGSSYVLQLYTCSSAGCSDSITAGNPAPPYPVNWYDGQITLNVTSVWSQVPYTQDFSAYTPISETGAGDPTDVTIDPFNGTTYVDNEASDAMGSIASGATTASTLTVPADTAHDPFVTCNATTGTCARAATSDAGDRIITDQNGNIWFTQGGALTPAKDQSLNNSEIVEYDPSSNTFCSYQPPQPDANVRGVASTVSSNVQTIWFSEMWDSDSGVTGEVGPNVSSFIPGGCTASQTPVPLAATCQTQGQTNCLTTVLWPASQGDPEMLTPTPSQSSLWVSDTWANSITRLSDRTPSPYSLTSTNAYSIEGPYPWGIVADSSYVYAIDYGDNQLLQINQATGEINETQIPVTSDTEEGYGLTLLNGTLYFTLSDDSIFFTKNYNSFGDAATFGYVNINAWESEVSSNACAPNANCPPPAGQAVVYSGIPSSTSDFRGLAASSSGTIMIANGNHEIDELTPLPPAVAGISPSAGTADGGSSVTISGSGFTGTSAVDFGSTPASTYTVDSSTEITAVSPAESAGTVDLTVTTPVGTSSTSSADQFTYQ